MTRLRSRHALCVAVPALALCACGPSKTASSSKTPDTPGPAARPTTAGTPARPSAPTGKPGAATPAPQTEVSCEALNKKNEQCMDAYVDHTRNEAERRLKQALSQVDPSQKKELKQTLVRIVRRATAQLKKALTGPEFMKVCEVEMKKDTEKARRDKRQITGCFMKQDCREYVRCVMSK